MDFGGGGRGKRRMRRRRGRGRGAFDIHLVPVIYSEFNTPTIG